MHAARAQACLAAARRTQGYRRDGSHQGSGAVASCTRMPPGPGPAGAGRLGGRQTAPSSPQQAGRLTGRFTARIPSMGAHRRGRRWEWL